MHPATLVWLSLATCLAPVTDEEAQERREQFEKLKEQQEAREQLDLANDPASDALDGCLTRLSPEECLVSKTTTTTTTSTATTTNTTTAQGMACDLAPVLLKVLELKEKVGEVEEQLVEVIDAAVQLTKVVKLGGAASGLGLAIFIIYLFVSAVVVIVGYSKNRQTERAEAKAKDINKAANRAAKKLYKKSGRSESRDSREDLTLM